MFLGLFSGIQELPVTAQEEAWICRSRTQGQAALPSLEVGWCRGFKVTRAGKMSTSLATRASGATGQGWGVGVEAWSLDLLAP